MINRIEYYELSEWAKTQPKDFADPSLPDLIIIKVAWGFRIKKWIKWNKEDCQWFETYTEMISNNKDVIASCYNKTIYPSSFLSILMM